MQSITIKSNTVVLDDPAKTLNSSHKLRVKSGDWAFDIEKEVSFTGLEIIRVFLFHKHHLKDLLNKNATEYPHNLDFPTSQIVFCDVDQYPENSGDYSDYESFFFKACQAADTNNVISVPFDGFSFSTDDRDFNINLFQINNENIGILIDFSI